MPLPKRLPAVGGVEERPLAMAACCAGERGRPGPAGGICGGGETAPLLGGRLEIADGGTGDGVPRVGGVEERPLAIAACCTGERGLLGPAGGTCGGGETAPLLGGRPEIADGGTGDGVPRVGGVGEDTAPNCKKVKYKLRANLVQPKLVSVEYLN